MNPARFPGKLGMTFFLVDYGYLCATAYGAKKNDPVEVVFGLKHFGNESVAALLRLLLLLGRLHGL